MISKLEAIAFLLNRPRVRSSRSSNMERKLTTIYCFSLRSLKVRADTYRIYDCSSIDG